MYKLLLVSDQEDVLDAFAQIKNWELLGFKQPHIRHDYEGTIDSLAKHHADGICIAVNADQEELILTYLQQHFPNVSIFEAGHTEEEVLRYLSELKILLNRIHADFYNERTNTKDILQMCRHEFFPCQQFIAVAQPGFLNLIRRIGICACFEAAWMQTGRVC